jgi:ADP-ribose pyrophosphatase YjhB (NUDIX family)
MLLIRPSRDEVRLPKGHVEAGETLRAAALREVAEETGYDDWKSSRPWEVSW